VAHSAPSPSARGDAAQWGRCSSCGAALMHVQPSPLYTPDRWLLALTNTPESVDSAPVRHTLYIFRPASTDDPPREPAALVPSASPQSHPIDRSRMGEHKAAEGQHVGHVDRMPHDAVESTGLNPAIGSNDPETASQPQGRHQYEQPLRTGSCSQGSRAERARVPRGGATAGAWFHTRPGWRAASHRRQPRGRAGAWRRI
jgi:hypothetical protein